MYCQDFQQNELKIDLPDKLSKNVLITIVFLTCKHIMKLNIYQAIENKKPGASAPGKTKNQLIVIFFCHLIPVYDAPESIYIIRSPILVFKVVRVFPNVNY